MADRVTILRLYHRASLALLGDGQRIAPIGWSAQEMLEGIELDVLAKEANQVARVAYVFHNEADAPMQLASAYIDALGFAPEISETDTLLRSETVPKGVREDWFDAFDEKCQPDETIYVIALGSEENREKFRSASSEILFL